MSDSDDSSVREERVYAPITAFPGADNSGPVVELCGHRVALREASARAETEQICHVVPEGLAQFARLRLDGAGFDATIDIDGKSIGVHKALLAARIPYFRALLDPNYAEGAAGRAHISSTNFSEFDGATIESLLDYAYTGQLELTRDNVQTMMECATFMGINDVVESCGRFMYARIRYDDAIPLLLFFREIGYMQKETSLLRWIDLNFVPISFTPEFAELAVDDLRAVLQRDSLRVDREKQVFDAVYRWITADEEKRRDYGIRLLACVRWGLISLSAIDASIEGTPWIRDKEECGVIVRKERETGAKSTHERLCGDRLQLMLLCPNGFGRLGFSRRAAETFLYNPYTDTWTKSTTQGHSVRSHALVVIGKKMYSVGGDDFRCRVFDTVSNLWQESASLTEDRLWPAAAATAGVIICAGGHGGRGPSTRGALASAEKFDTTAANPVWTRIAPMHKRREYAVACALNGKIYVIGGGISERVTELCGDAEIYDPATGRWTLTAPMSHPRFGGGVAVLNGCIYFVGGQVEYEVGVKHVERYDPATDTWTTLQQTPHVTSWPFVGVSQGKLYAFEPDNAGEPDRLTVYDPATDCWEERQLPATGGFWQGCGFAVPADQPTPLEDGQDQ